MLKRLFFYIQKNNSNNVFFKKDSIRIILKLCSIIGNVINCKFVDMSSNLIIAFSKIGY